ncbi:Cystathionine beta-lyase PatB [Serratia plymuthica]|nr:Cystathionine beta-lyase PatB [Serratia plymuthica]
MNEIVDFNEVIRRRPADSQMHSTYSVNVLPMHLAETDFLSPLVVRKKLAERVTIGHYGYMPVNDQFNEVIKNWFDNRHHLFIDKDWINFSPSTGSAIFYGIELGSVAGDEVAVFTPIYHAFKKIIENSGRTYRAIPLCLDNKGYHVDFAHFETLLSTKNIKILLICNPHNPVGNKWQDADLKRICELCSKYNVFIISDEIYCDLTYDRQHTSLLNYRKIVDNKLMICVSPSKTFNLSGMRASAVIIPSQTYYDLFNMMLIKHKSNDRGIFGVTSLQAAYDSGAPYLDAMLDYIKGNLEMMMCYFAEEIPEMSIFPPQFGYMAWIDVSVLENKTQMPCDFFLEKFAQIGVRSGQVFGNGNGFIRMSFGYPKDILYDAILRIGKAVKKYS